MKMDFLLAVSISLRSRAAVPSSALLHTHLCILKLRFQTGCILGKLDAFLLCLLQQTGDIVQLILQSKQPKGNSTAQIPLGAGTAQHKTSANSRYSKTATEPKRESDSEPRTLKFGYKMEVKCQS